MTTNFNVEIACNLGNFSSFLQSYASFACSYPSKGPTRTGFRRMAHANTKIPAFSASSARDQESALNKLGLARQLLTKRRQSLRRFERPEIMSADVSRRAILKSAIAGILAGAIGAPTIVRAQARGLS